MRSYKEKDKKPVIEEAKLSGGRKIEAKREERLHTFGERIKELNCLYNFSKLVERQNVSLKEIFQKVIKLIPSAWQYPDIICVRIVFENKEYKTDNFRMSKCKEKADIKVHGKNPGWMEVCCLKGKGGNYEGLFLGGKKNLIEDIAERLGRVSEHKMAEEKHKALDKELVRINRKFKRLALIDAHTGLYNYRYLREIIEAEYERVKRHGQNLSVIIMDIDYFKSLNDAYGHRFGDRILKQFAAHLKALVRKYDITIRFCGEEFIIISPGANRKAVLALAERILKAINAYDFGNKKHTVTLKVSMGVYSYPEDGQVKHGMDLISIADNILNKAKVDGGNRVYSSFDMIEERADEITQEDMHIKILKNKIEKLTKRSKQSVVEAIFALAKTIKLKNHYTGEHVEKTVRYAVQIAKALKLSQEETERVGKAARLHDLGKIGITDRILLKRGKLTKKEYEIIKKHVQIAADILRPIHFLNDVIPSILHHHERWDGEGYPNGLKGEQIPVGARIIAAADVYQALISNRPYRKAYTKNEAMKIIKEGSGSQFEPKIVKTLLKLLRKEK